jgi:hypothetical protein
LTMPEDVHPDRNTWVEFKILAIEPPLVRWQLEAPLVLPPG